MCEGWAYDEVGRAEGVTAERIRQIVSEVLQKRKVDSGTEHARVQLARLERLMHFAGEAVARGELKQGRQEALSRELNLAARNLGSPSFGSGCGGGSPRLERFFSEGEERAAGVR
jgi:hypothetical protein